MECGLGDYWWVLFCLDLFWVSALIAAPITIPVPKPLSMSISVMSQLLKIEIKVTLILMEKPKNKVTARASQWSGCVGGVRFLEIRAPQMADRMKIDRRKMSMGGCLLLLLAGDIIPGCCIFSAL